MAVIAHRIFSLAAPEPLLAAAQGDEEVDDRSDDQDLRHNKDKSVFHTTKMAQHHSRDAVKSPTQPSHTLTSRSSNCFSTSFQNGVPACMNSAILPNRWTREHACKLQTSQCIVQSPLLTASISPSSGASSLLPWMARACAQPVSCLSCSAAMGL